MSSRPACDLDAGLAPATFPLIRQAGQNRRVKAIVFRVDSPGGDALASDLVAEALREAGQEKPVIVSQGTVAASGGYWISMYGDTILAAPNTITGSIGVINGWFYDKGFKEKIGLSTDLVKRGNFADLGFGILLPLVNIRLADRNLTEEEFEIMKAQGMAIYEDFLAKAAEGRGMDCEEMEAYAQGRIWSGLDGVAIGLVDEIGGLADAIRMAREKAGLPPGEKVRIVEFPAMGGFTSTAGAIMTRLFGVEKETDPLLEEVKFRTRHNGEPLPVLPLEFTMP